LPVAVLKIDRSFIRGLGEDSEDTVMLSAIIDLARALGMRVVAEGVETANQLTLLRELGCEMAQGNYFSEPLPGEAASMLLVGHPK
jgi:EAL domain-containing protein (putative c-di-GMP-specific phosphodiesterase class I)